MHFLFRNDKAGQVRPSRQPGSVEHEQAGQSKVDLVLAIRGQKMNRE